MFSVRVVAPKIVLGLDVVESRRSRQAAHLFINRGSSRCGLRMKCMHVRPRARTQRTMHRRPYLYTAGARGCRGLQDGELQDTQLGSEEHDHHDGQRVSLELLDGL